MPQLMVGALQPVANAGALPTPIASVWMFRVTVDTQRLWMSDGVTWIDITDSILTQVSQNIDGGNSTSNYTSTITVDGGGA